MAAVGEKQMAIDTRMGAAPHWQARPRSLGSVSEFARRANERLTGRVTGRRATRSPDPLADYLKGRSIYGFVLGAGGARCSPRLERRAARGRSDEGAAVIAREERQARGGRSFLNCPRCGLTIKSRAPWLAIRFCPRCLARSQLAVELFSSPLRAEALYAEGSAPRADRCGTERRLGLK